MASNFCQISVLISYMGIDHYIIKKLCDSALWKYEVILKHNLLQDSLMSPADVKQTVGSEFLFFLWAG